MCPGGIYMSCKDEIYRDLFLISELYLDLGRSESDAAASQLKLYHDGKQFNFFPWSIKQVVIPHVNFFIVIIIYYRIELLLINTNLLTSRPLLMNAVYRGRKSNNYFSTEVTFWPSSENFNPKQYIAFP